VFGYVECANDELRLKELKQYKAYYCGVCRSLCRISPLCSFTLSSDAVFYALLTDASNSNIVKQRCSFGLKSCLCAVGERVDNAAIINTILFIRKLNDDIADKQYYKKLLMPLFFKADKTTRVLAEEAVEYCDKKLNILNKLERSGCDSVEECADVFAQMCAGLCCPDFVIGKERWITHHIGYYVSKWVYIIDALDDMEDDLEKHLFNPLINKMLNGKRSRREVVTEVSNELYSCVREAELATQLLPDSINASILENIVSCGLRNVTKRIVLSKGVEL